MSTRKLTRKALVRQGAASAVVLAASFNATGANAAAADGSAVAGRFVSARDERSAIVSFDAEGSVLVTLDADAFVTHGFDGVVESLKAFVPGEEVAVRGGRSEAGIAAVEFQSVYTRVTGSIATEGNGWSIDSPTGRVRVPQDVAQRDVPAQVRSGATWSATVWVHPVSGEATAVGLSAGD
jgi:hypothetical protein